MRAITILTTILFLSIAGYGQQKKAPVKLTYKGKIKAIQFDYYNNWKLTDEVTGVTLTPDGFKDNYVEIDKEKWAGTEAQFLDTLKAEGTLAEPTMFNGMKAYKMLENEYANQYFIFVNDHLYYTFGLRCNKEHRDEAQVILKSFKMK
ncbi:MAG: hypothetical protein JST70_11535 [Bacteroidetes bacterium]|nr:hypothetical protein [Bacteroidota bacterium]